MKLCPLEKCKRYSEAKPDERKCYYGEPQCWKGWLDLFSHIISRMFNWHNFLLIKGLFLVTCGIRFTTDFHLLKYTFVAMGVALIISWIVDIKCPNIINKLAQCNKLLSGKKYYIPFCISCFLIALGIGLYMSQSGIGVSPDSAHYISVGENLKLGNGYTTAIGGNVYTNATPVYPMAIAALCFLGLAAEQAARFIPIFCYALLVFPLFFIGKNSSIPDSASCSLSLSHKLLN